MQTAEKTCFKCLCKKPLSAFYKHAMMADGRLNKCIECTKADANRHRQENLEKVRAYDRLRGGIPHRVAARKEYARTDAGKKSAKNARVVYVSKFPNRIKANTALGNALRDGKLIAEPCFICGAKAQGHHSSYDFPLGVTWLCPKHHAEAHKLTRELNREKKAA